MAAVEEAAPPGRAEATAGAEETAATTGEEGWGEDEEWAQMMADEEAAEAAWAADEDAEARLEGEGDGAGGEGRQQGGAEEGWTVVRSRRRHVPRGTRVGMVVWWWLEGVEGLPTGWARGRIADVRIWEGRQEHAIQVDDASGVGARLVYVDLWRARWYAEDEERREGGAARQLGVRAVGARADGSLTGQRPAGVRDVWTRRGEAVRANARVHAGQAEMLAALEAAQEVLGKVGATGSPAGRMVRTALAATEDSLFEGREAGDLGFYAMASVIGGYVPGVEWGGGRTKGLRAVFEGQVQRVQTAAADMLVGWRDEVKEARKWTGRREQGRGRMGAVMWAWREVAARDRGRWAPSTRVVSERNGSGVDALPAAEGGEWGERCSVSAWRAGSMWAWIYAWCMWRAPEKTAERVLWAAWRVRMAGGGDWARRYAEAVRGGARPVPEGYLGKKLDRWARMCAMHRAPEDEVEGVAVGMAWTAAGVKVTLRTHAEGVAMGVKCVPRSVEIAPRAHCGPSGRKRVRRAGLPRAGRVMVGETKQVPVHEIVAGRHAAWMEAWRRRRDGQHASARREAAEVTRKRKAAGGWPPEDRREAGRRRLQEHMERARAGARAGAGGGGDEGGGDLEEAVVIEEGGVAAGEAEVAHGVHGGAGVDVGRDGQPQTMEGGERGKRTGDG